MDQENSANCITSAATAVIQRHRSRLGVTKQDILRGVAEWDDRFSGSQYWRIEEGRAPWTLDRFAFVAMAMGLEPAALFAEVMREVDVLRNRDGPHGRSEQTDEA